MVCRNGPSYGRRMGWHGVDAWQAGLAETPGYFEEDVRGQAAPDSFDACYQDQAWFTIFWLFCNSEYATENLDFIRAVDQFASTGDLNVAQEIYDRYVKDDAPTQVNLRSSNRTTLDELLGPDGEGHGPPDMFDSSREEIQALVRSDNYARFLRELVEVQTILWGETAGADAWWNEDAPRVES